MYLVTPTESTPIGIKQKSATQCIGGFCLRESGLVLKYRIVGLLERARVESMKIWRKTRNEMKFRNWCGRPLAWSGSELYRWCIVDVRLHLERTTSRYLKLREIMGMQPNSLSQIYTSPNCQYNSNNN